MLTTRSDIRNIAIIAHVDHGKTTLVDGMLRQSHVFREGSVMEERVLDSNDLERERGITILAKNTAVTYKNVKINIVDTPGHADFGGEVERVLNMVDAALLLVDCVEGPMPQTRFVLRKALGLGLKVIVVINKVDRANARVSDVLNETFDLFIELGATDEQADFPVVYAVGLHGQSGYDHEDMAPDLIPLFETILKEVPVPTVDEDAPAAMLVTSLEYDNYKGQIAVGRLTAGKMTRGMSVVRLNADGLRQPGRLEYLFTFHNLAKVDVDEVRAGDILALSGFETLEISDTIASPEVTEALPGIRVEEPTVRMTFGVNTSPFAGREGKTGLGTSRRIRQRLYDETRRNVALRVQDGDTADRFVVSGRGELHLGILIETMRREGFEFEVSKPEVIYLKPDSDGPTLEPVEHVHIEVADSHVGTIVELLGDRRGRMVNMSNSSGTTYMEYYVPTRGLLGFRSHLMRATGGMGQIHSIFHDYEPVVGEIPGRRFGSLVAMEMGMATAYSLVSLHQRGTFFINPGTEVYEGMVIGENIRPEDMPMNIIKAKHLDNFRAKPTEVVAGLPPARRMSLDDFIEFMEEDELLEVTPQSLRIRKRILNTDVRMREDKRRSQLVSQ